MALWKEEVKHLHEATFENKPPETCLELFEATLNFIALKNRVQKADQKWIEEFLEQGGLEKVFETLAMISNKDSLGLSDAMRELECVQCIKSIMNHQFGMEYVIRAEKKFIYKLTQG